MKTLTYKQVHDRFELQLERFRELEDEFKGTGQLHSHLNALNSYLDDLESELEELQEIVSSDEDPDDELELSDEDDEDDEDDEGSDILAQYESWRSQGIM